jgi:uncharacterized protein YdeI (YjbR/CyaY-like superfamily)
MAPRDDDRIHPTTRAGTAANVEACPRSAKRGILEWIVQAKHAETRARRVEETARRAARDERANQWRPKDA